jgi:anhydro-N-acetylmuramic acid kinase
MTPPPLFIGLMSGTSLDGIDAVLADLGGVQPRTLAHVHRPFAPALRGALLALNLRGDDELHRAARAGADLARASAAAVDALLQAAGVTAAAVRAIGSHGQTVRHQPALGYTIQLDAPALLAELTGIDVVADFRSRDIAAGGQGAPLVPAFHAAVFGAAHARAIVNIGGIANITCLPAAGQRSVNGFDCGPGNVLLDLWAQRHLDRPYDANGAFAASGRVSETLLEALRAEPFFALAPPKSTGRDLFNAAWLDEKLAAHAALTAADVQATLTALTAHGIADAIASHATDAAEVIVCGGGARNATLMSMLGRLCAPLTLQSSDALGVPAEHVEALAFAWLARAHVDRRSANLPDVTGARGARVLGALYPR